MGMCRDTGGMEIDMVKEMAEGLGNSGAALEQLIEKASKVGVAHAEPTEKLLETIKAAIKNKRKVHFLPQYRHDNLIKIENLTGIHPP